MDYNGSMIYDEYPDRMALYRLGEDIYDKIRREEEQADEGRAAVERELAAGASARKRTERKPRHVCRTERKLRRRRLRQYLKRRLSSRGRSRCRSLPAGKRNGIIEEI